MKLIALQTFVMQSLDIGMNILETQQGEGKP